MLENTSRNRRILAGVAGVNLAFAVAVGVGAVPRPGDDAVRTATVALEQVDAAGPVHAGVAAGQSETPATVVATEAPAHAAPATKASTPRTTTPPTTKAPRPTRTTAAPAPATAAAPPAAAPVPTAPVKVPRRTPSAAEVQAAITQLKQQVGGLLLLVSPTPDQIAQAGDQVCTAFDNGQTFAQVKATGLSMIPASITVSPATVDWAVRQAVTLYCPGHANKLV